MRLALLRSAQDSTPLHGDVPWDKLAQTLTTHARTDCSPCPGKECAKKNGRAWSPTDYETGSKRGSAHVRAITAAVFDLEGPGHSPLPDARMLALAHRVDGYAYACHSTHGGRGFYRLVLPLSRSVLPAEWPRVWAAAIRLLELPADSTCGDLARIYFLPSAPAGTPVVAERAEGRPLDVDALLREPVPPPAAPPASPPVAQEPVDLDALRGALRRLRKPESAEWARKVLAGASLAPAGQHDDALNRVAGLLATALPAETSYAAIQMLIEPSIRAMGCTGEHQGEKGLEEFRRKFDRARARRVASDKQRDEDHAALLKVLGVTAVAEDGKVERNLNDWRSGLLYNADGEGPTGLKQCEANAELIFRCDDRWKGKVRFNEVTKQVEVKGTPVDGAAVSVQDAEAMNWLQRSEYRLTLKVSQVGAQLLVVARRNAFDPLADFLKECRQKWDRTTRIDSLFTEYFGAEDTSHHRRISRRWLISLVARALKPGCKVDTVLILQGNQGKLKSSALDVLSAPWFTDTPIDVHNKDSRIMASMKWIVEMGELTSFRRSDAESLKAFFSAREDFLRPSYGRVLESFARRCVFVGSTNLDEYLSDPTGHRRFWPVRIGDIALDRLREDRDQLLGEAVAAFEAGERWWLEGAEAGEAEDVAAEHAHTRASTALVLDWYLSLESANRPAEVRTIEVARQALGMSSDRITNGVQQELGIALRELGFTKHRRRRAGVLLNVYCAPESLRMAARGAPVRPLIDLLPDVGEV